MPLRSFGGPLLAAVAMALVGVGVPLPAIPAGALALLTYAGVLGAFEYALFPDDVRSYLRSLPRLGRARLTVR
jgi:hypothetical protein